MKHDDVIGEEVCEAQEKEIRDVISYYCGQEGRGLQSSTFQLNLSRFGHTSPCPPV